MKKIISLCLTLALALSALTACGADVPSSSGTVVACTTYPVYLLTQAVTDSVPDVDVELVVNQPLSCLHNYTLTMTDMKLIERADVLVINGAGLESFLADVLDARPYLDATQGLPLLCSEGHHHEENHDEDEEEFDPHCWLDPTLAGQMAQNIATGLAAQDPTHKAAYTDNAQHIMTELTALQTELRGEVAELSCTELIPFHDGFRYFAEAFGLTILASVEEEEGAEASAREIGELTELIRSHQLPCVFVEKNGSDSAAQALSLECGIAVAALDMGMSGAASGGGLDTYEGLLRYNIETIREAYT